MMCGGHINPPAVTYMIAAFVMALKLPKFLKALDRHRYHTQHPATEVKKKKKNEYSNVKSSCDWNNEFCIRSSMLADGGMSQEFSHSLSLLFKILFHEHS